MKIIGVIMTYNCESLVQKAIDQIPKEEFDKLICTDDGSTDNTIEITGEVSRPTVIAYKKGLSVNDAIGQADGLNDLAKRRGVFVVYQNGNVSSTKKYFIFRRMPKLEPGSKVVVPKKIANPNKTSIAEIIGLTSTLATLAVLIKSL